jgi:hypothetical protein
MATENWTSEVLGNCIYCRRTAVQNSHLSHIVLCHYDGHLMWLTTNTETSHFLGLNLWYYHLTDYTVSMAGWLENNKTCKDLEGSNHVLIKVLLSAGCLQALRKSIDSFSKIAGVLSEIQTWYLPNFSSVSLVYQLAWCQNPWSYWLLVLL